MEEDDLEQKLLKARDKAMFYLENATKPEELHALKYAIKQYFEVYEEYYRIYGRIRTDEVDEKNDKNRS